jgi:hypothetical protein
MPVNATPLRRSTIALALLLAAGCAHNAPRGPLPPHAATEIRVVVENRGWEDLTIYASHGGARHWVGHVTAAQRAVMRLPHGMHGTVHLQADPVGSAQAFSTEMLRVEPGDRIEWTIESARIHSSSLVYRPR